MFTRRLVRYLHCQGVGKYTNEQMKKAMEALLLVDSSIEVSQDAAINFFPCPRTLIMNGDLTAYFHPYERIDYKNIYHNLQGLVSYFPRLGNHELDHYNGAKYGGNQWGGWPYCNMAHSIGYIRDGFCGSIPNFLIQSTWFGMMHRASLTAGRRDVTILL